MPSSIRLNDQPRWTAGLKLELSEFLHACIITMIGLGLSASIGSIVKCLHFCLAGMCSEFCSLYFKLVLIKCHLFLVVLLWARMLPRLVRCADIIALWLLHTECTWFFNFLLSTCLGSSMLLCFLRTQPHEVLFCATGSHASLQVYSKQSCSWHIWASGYVWQLRYFDQRWPIKSMLGWGLSFGHRP